MSDVRISALSDQELIDRVRANALFSNDLTDELVNRLEDTTGALETYSNIGSVMDIYVALKAAQRASLLLDLHGLQCKEVVEGTEALDNAMKKLSLEG